MELIAKQRARRTYEKTNRFMEINTTNKNGSTKGSNATTKGMFLTLIGQSRGDAFGGSTGGGGSCGEGGEGVEGVYAVGLVPCL